MYPGRNKTIKLLAERYYWPGLSSDVAQYVQNCHSCRRALVPRDRPPGLLQPLPIPDRPWQHILMDFKEFLPDKHGFDMLFVIVDRLSKRPRSIPCKKTVTAKGMAKLFIFYILLVYGIPNLIVSDQGP